MFLAGVCVGVGLATVVGVVVGGRVVRGLLSQMAVQSEASGGLLEKSLVAVSAAIERSARVVAYPQPVQVVDPADGGGFGLQSDLSEDREPEPVWASDDFAEGLTGVRR